jgi:hypothetical protein
MGEAAKKKTKLSSLSEAHRNQIAVLRAMAGDGDDPSVCNKLFHLNDIATASGLGDPKETQRCLFILEGQKLVVPNPEGDFTSVHWRVTRQGLKFMKVVVQAVK